MEANRGAGKPDGAPPRGDRWLYALPALAAVDLGLLVLAGTGIDLVRPQHVLIPGFVSLGLVSLSLAAGRMLTKDPARVALVAVLLVLALGTLGDVSEAFRAASTLYLVGGEPALTLLYVVALTGPILAIRQLSRPVLEWCRFAGLALGILFAFTAVQLVRQLAATPRAPVEPGIQGAGVRSSRPPDIYLLVLDKYTGPAQLQRHYGLNIAPFVGWLREHGFLIPEEHRANYAQTFLTLASVLNLRYLDEYPARFGARARDRTLAGPDIENNRLAAFLKAQGYRFVFVPSAFDVTRRNRYADHQIPDPRDVRADFTVAWYRSTAIPVLHRLGCAVLGCDATRWPYISESADVLDAKFGHLASLARTDQPTFVFAHLLLPHEPYLYLADCSRRRPYWPSADTGSDARPVRLAYAAQIECTNRKLQTLTEAIQREAAVPPIILIQSDHGHGRMGHPVFPLGRWLPPELVEERLSPFAAYALPGLPPDSVHPGITPVNVMRLVLRHYFRADLPPLEDASYWSSTGRPYDFVRVFPSHP